MITAVLFDFGGVITTSPFDNFAIYEKERGLPPDTIRRINSTNPDDNAWAQFERSELDRAGFAEAFRTEAAEHGFTIPGEDVLGCLHTEVRPFMVDAVEAIHEKFRTAILTNNFTSKDDSDADLHKRESVLQHFDAMIESSKVGVRKPMPEFYEIACKEVGVEPANCVFLDDLGINLKPARAMGMTTIKVVDPHVALAELGEVLGMELAPQDS